MNTISIIVKGKVQGVFYRQSAKEIATNIGITGHIKNQPDGCVYIIATGETTQLSIFLEWCKIGPSKAMVTTIETHSEPLQIFNTFNIIRF